MTRIIIGALSGWKYHERRARCLTTWMADGEQVAIRSVFLLGCPTLVEPELTGPHYLCLPCPDDYPSLPLRTWNFCRWAMGQPDWDYLLKCDDDSFVCIPRLVVYDCQERPYIGAEWKKGVDYGSGGAGYLIDRKAAAIVAEQSAPGPGAEDVWVGNVLRAAGVRLSIDEKFIPFGSMIHRPAVGNSFITLHGVDAPAFMASHEETGLAAEKQPAGQTVPG